MYVYNICQTKNAEDKLRAQHTFPTYYNGTCILTELALRLGGSGTSLYYGNNYITSKTVCQHFCEFFSKKLFCPINWGLTVC